MDRLVYDDTAPRVFVYRNLHQSCWSVKALSGEHRGKVVLHCASLAMQGIFKVQQGGRARTINTQTKNVHAGAIGYMVYANVITERCSISANYHDEQQPPIHDASRLVTYNPYKYDSFVYVDDESPVVWDDELLITLHNDMTVRAVA